MNRTLFRRGFVLIAVIFPSPFGLAPTVRAVCQKGCLENQNTVLGDGALVTNTTGFANTATGFNTLLHNTTGSFNTATGNSTLNSNKIGHDNTATSDIALIDNETGNDNTATGSHALWKNFSGSENTATGTGALQNNEAGSSNTADGANALYNTSGNNNIALGANAGLNLTDGDDNIDIGNACFPGESNKIRIGTEGTHTATYIAGIRETGLVHGAAVAVGITADGQLGVRASSARFNESVKPIDRASEAIFSLQPVTFRYKNDTAALLQFGLVAEEVAKINPDLVARDVEGKPFTVRYDEINAMLLNEFVKEHRKVQELEAKAARQQKQIEALTAGLQKVSAQLELSKSASRTVLNNH